MRAIEQFAPETHSRGDGPMALSWRQVVHDISTNEHPRHAGARRSVEPGIHLIAWRFELARTIHEHPTAPAQ